MVSYLKKVSLYEKIYNDILEGIQTSKFPPGSKLPSEKELSIQYNVSRITSKKALDMLAEQNLISRMPGKGSYVMENQENEYLRQEPLRNSKKQSRIIGVIISLPE